jgi:hypothetical protein
MSRLPLDSFAGAAGAGNTPGRPRGRSMTEREIRAYLMAREVIRHVRSTALAPCRPGAPPPEARPSAGPR